MSMDADEIGLESMTPAVAVEMDLTAPIVKLVERIDHRHVKNLVAGQTALIEIVVRLHQHARKPELNERIDLYHFVCCGRRDCD